MLYLVTMAGGAVPSRTLRFGRTWHSCRFRNIELKSFLFSSEGGKTQFKSSRSLRVPKQGGYLCLETRCTCSSRPPHQVSTASDLGEQLGINGVVQYEVVVPPLPVHAAVGGGLVAVASEENGDGSLSAEVDGGDCVVENRFYHGGNLFAILPVVEFVASSTEEEMKPSSLPTSAEGTAREASQEVVLTDWPSIVARAHKLLGCSASTCSYHPVWPRLQEEHSPTGPVCNGETVTELQSRNERNKSPLDQKKPTQAMVMEQGGGIAGKQILDIWYDFFYTIMKENDSGIGIANRKGTNISSASWKGEKGMNAGNSEDGKAETGVRIGCSLAEVGSSRGGCADGRPRKRDEEEEEEEEEGSSIKKKVRMRSLTSIYEDIRSLMPSSSELNTHPENY
ncbi:hypothetical protein J1N35_032176 [Gossypium stocksii]|uniref:Uncharacterized protein n=1 Tax=Gossypium stocksii TaxID=47602 RepID=A0A9D3V5P2_9ROSI|nr:hypothetical protein J1N35_032176 [Gossypium stocksii]